MKTYLSELLTEDVVPETVSKVKEQKLERLLQNVSVVETPTVVTQVSASVEKSTLSSKKSSTKKVEEKYAIKTSSVEVNNSGKLVTAKSSAKIDVVIEKSYRQGDFQAMFFDVAGLTVAVPLIELGGIHNTDKITALMGKPDWFSGVMLYRDEKINVVDTALWVMPEKCDEALKNSLNYQYIIMLSDSRWGLSAEKLVDTVVLKQSDVKWLDSPNKRPWLAGLVKDRMCALLDVESLICLLDKGAGIQK
ncbi:MAG: chemotaxis protein CheW [Alteromonadaceae bacterium]|nr:chemotaxis protein CheW [Alteromonadaceae bacterium]